jgi:hypothetical protein
MKEIFTKIQNNKWLMKMPQIIVLILLFDFIIAPGLTLDNTLINIVSLLIGLTSLTYLFFLLELDTIFKKQNKTKENDRN